MDGRQSSSCRRRDVVSWTFSEVGVGSRLAGRKSRRGKRWPSFVLGRRS